jgi:hypothetical protein
MKRRRGDFRTTSIANRSRRDALGMIAAAAAAPVSLVSASIMSAATAETAVLAVFRNRAAAGHAGRVVLASLPAPASRATLLAAILDVLAPGGALPVGTDAIRARISERIRADFAAGRTRTVDGWLLSVTETHLYALAALVSV